MKKRMWALIGLCLLPCSPAAFAGADLVIYYAGRPGITYQNVPGLEYVFFELDQIREEAQLAVEAEVGQLSSRINSQDLAIAEDLTFRLTGLNAQRVRFTATGFGSHLYFGFRCPVNIKKAKIDATFSQATVQTDYDLLTGSTPYQVDLSGFNIRVRPGISVCSLASIFSLLGFDLGEILTALLEDTFRNKIEDALTDTFNLQGLGYSFLDLDPYLEVVPDFLFQQVGITKNEVLDVLRNPFSGISVKVTFDEDGVGYNGANDRLKIWIEVPWEKPPVPAFTHQTLSILNNTLIPDQGSFEVEFDASGSYDPDGGSITTYHWVIDGRSYFSTQPTVTHIFPDGGTKWVSLTVTDDEGVRQTDSRVIYICSDFPPFQDANCELPSKN